MTCFEGLTWFCVPLTVFLRVSEGVALVSVSLVVLLVLGRVVLGRLFNLR